jgi:hypothetical protein
MGIIIRMFVLVMVLSGSLYSLTSSAAYSNPDILLNFQRNAPADTTFYVDGLVGKETAAVAQSLAVYNLQLELLVAELEGLNADQYSAEIDFLATLLKHGLDAQNEGHDALRNYYGLDDSLASAVYLDGLIPVLQLAIGDKNSLINAFSRASKESGVEHKTQIWGRHTVDYWVLQTKQDLGFDLWLALAVKDQVASVALMPAQFSQARRLDVLGLLPEAYSLADSQGMVEVREAEDFLNYTAGFVNLLEIARLATDPHSSKTGEDLIALSGQGALPLVSVACRRDWLDLAQAMPKLVFGYDSMRQQKNASRLDGHMLLQVQDVGLTQALQKLNGHIPSYALSSKDVLLSAALGVDMATLMPVISQLRRQALSAHFDCQDLIAMQAELMSADLSVLMVAAAAGQGISGVSAAIYDMDLSAMTNGNFVIDAIVSVTTEYPELLSNLVSFVPQLEGIEVPTDGSNVAIELAALPIGLSPKMAQKGKHVVIFDGPMAAEAAQYMTFEKPNKLGIFATSTNYKKLAEIANEALGLVANVGVSEASDCAELHANMATLYDTATAITMLVAAEDKGIRFDFNAYVVKPDDASNRRVKTGRYQLEMLADGCQWLPVGTETIKPDGTGQYKITDDTDQCALYQTQYNWQQQGRRLVFSETESLGRDSCSENMQTFELLNNSCIVLNVSVSGFDCLYSSSSSDRLIYRYILYP